MSKFQVGLVLQQLTDLHSLSHTLAPSCNDMDRRRTVQNRSTVLGLELY